MCTFRTNVEMLPETTGSLNPVLVGSVSGDPWKAPFWSGIPYQTPLSRNLSADQSAYLSTFQQCPFPCNPPSCRLSCQCSHTHTHTRTQPSLNQPGWVPRLWPGLISFSVPAGSHHGPAGEEAAYIQHVRDTPPAPRGPEALGNRKEQ